MCLSGGGTLSLSCMITLISRVQRWLDGITMYRVVTGGLFHSFTSHKVACAVEEKSIAFGSCGGYLLRSLYFFTIPGDSKMLRN